MHMTRRAPELSATSRLVCIWIMASDPLRLLLVRAALRQHFPGFGFRLRRAFDDAGDVAGLVDVGLVVRVVLLGPAHGLLQQRVKQRTLDLHHHSLVALVGDDNAFENSLRHLSSLLRPEPAWSAARS